MEKNKGREGRRETLWLIVGCLLMVSFASALEFDDIIKTPTIEKDVSFLIGDKLIEYTDIWVKYKPIEIKNFFGLGSTLFSGAITQHDDICGVDCKSTMQLYLANDGVLIDDVIFETLQDDGSWVEQDVRSYQFNYWGLINEHYEIQCIEEFNKVQCNNIMIDEHEGWINYNLGDEVKEGTYEVKLVAEKKPSRTVDWIIETNGKWLNEWATWGNISEGDDAEVILNSPIDDYILLANPQTFNITANVTGGAILTNMSLWTNETGSWEIKNTTDTSPFYSTEYQVNGVVLKLIHTYEVDNNTIYNVDFWLKSDLGDQIQTYTHFNYTDGTESIGALKYTDSTSYVNFETNNPQPTKLVESVSIYGMSVGTDGHFKNTTVESNTYNININRNINNNIIWNVQACDSDGDCGFAPANRTLYIDSTQPNITLESPIGTLNYGAIGQAETLNVTFTDENLDTCWYNYNGTNISIEGCLTGVLNSTTFVLEENNLNITIYANDSVGNLASEFVSWDYYILENSQTYPTTALETSTQTYTANLTYNSSTFGVITGKLTLNDTEYAGSRTGTGDNAIFSASAIMPSITAEVNLTAYWTISLTDVGGTTDYNLTSHNVTVEIINLSLCDATNNVPFWNYTILNESNVAEINSTFEATFTVKQTGSTTENIFSYSDTTGTNSQYDFCISPGEESYTIDTNIKLTKSGYVDKFYNYEEVVVTNSTREDNLYMLATEDSTSYIIHVVDVSGSDVYEAEVRVQRYYPGTDEWITTEIVTTNYVGEAIGHLLSEDADYRFRVYQSGVSTYNSTATKIICASAPCTVTLVIPIVLETGFEVIEDLTSTLTYSDTTNIFTYTYSDSSGDFDSARLYVIRVFPSNGTLVIPCNETKTTASGIITCDISLQVNGTYRATGYITRDDVESLDKRIDGVRGTNIYNSIGVDGVLWGFFILIAIIMLGITRPSLAIIFGVLGLIVIGLIRIVNIGAVSIIAVVAIAIILLMRIGKE